MSEFVPVSELLDRYEEQQTDWLVRRLPRRSDGFVCPDCGAEFRTEAGVRGHRRRKHGRRREVADA